MREFNFRRRYRASIFSPSRVQIILADSTVLAERIPPLSLARSACLPTCRSAGVTRQSRRCLRFARARPATFSPDGLSGTREKEQAREREGESTSERVIEATLDKDRARLVERVFNYNERIEMNYASRSSLSHRLSIGTIRSGLVMTRETIEEVDSLKVAMVKWRW